MGLDKMRVFSAVFERGSVLEASKVIGVTPSATSQALSSLEKELGVRLFQRFPRKLVPTERALELHGFLKNWLVEYDNYISNFQSGPTNEPVGTLRIGAPPEFGSQKVTKVIGKLKQYNKAKFEVRFGLPDQLTSRVAAGELDLAFCDYGSYLSKYKSVVVAEEVFSETAILVCSKEFYHKYVQGNLTYKHLSSLPHIDYRADAGVLALWYRHVFSKTPPQIDLRFVADNVTAIISGALEGLGLAFIPKHLIEAFLKKGSLIKISTKEKDYINPIMLVRAKARVPTPLEKIFIKSLDFKA